MRVAIFTDHDFTRVNGMTTTLRAVLAHAPADIRPRIYTCEARAVDQPGYFAARGVGVTIPFCHETELRLPPVHRLLRQVRQDGAEVLHLTAPGPVGLAALHVASRLDLPIIGSVDSDLAGSVRLVSGSDRLGRLMQQYVRWPYGRCERILAPSLAARQTLIDGRIEASRIGLWRRGVSCDHFSPLRRSAALRASWGASDDRPVLLYAGQVSGGKGLDLLPALTERLQRAGLRHRLVIVGDGPLRSALSDRCTGAIFTGSLSASAVADAMASADVFVFPSRTDSAASAVLEAQASGLPVLVTDEGGAHENMIDGETGYVCRDLRAFTMRASELLLTRERRQRLGTQARAYAATRRWEATLEPLYRAYREARASAGAGAASDVSPALVPTYAHSWARST